MGAFDIAVIVLVSVAFLGAVGYLIWRKAKGKGGCDCGCSGCPYACNCGKRKDESEGKK